MSGLKIRLIQAKDVPEMTAAFAGIDSNRPVSQYEDYLREQFQGEREVLVAFQDGSFAGYLTIVWSSNYHPFRIEGIPEIVDFNTLPKLRRCGIGSRLMDEAERRIAERSSIVGIGVGMDANYGAAQRLYVKRGYIPDGRGLVSHARQVASGENVLVDDGLALYFTKDLSQ